MDVFPFVPILLKGWEDNMIQLPFLSPKGENKIKSKEFTMLLTEKNISFRIHPPNVFPRRDTKASLYKYLVFYLFTLELI
jgi:hypothetical protein